MAVSNVAPQKKHVLSALGVLGVSVLVALGVGWATGQGGAEKWGLPLMLLLAIPPFAINWAAFVPAYALRSEHFYDLTGALTYLTTVAVALWLSPHPMARAYVLTALVSVWAIRLGGFLFMRVKRVGKDARFDEMKQSFPRFFIAWTLQGLWVFLTLAAALVAVVDAQPTPLGIRDVVGVFIWCLGFGIEAVADWQKSTFKKNPQNADRFIDRGLWAWSRHPNYFGEILLWTGVAVAASSAFQGWQWVALVSPIFVTLLLTQVSGIPLLTERAEKKWGQDPAYRAYVARTSLLVPRPPR
jgi:steroid 5-alpha reductase family enzyme